MRRWIAAAVAVVATAIGWAREIRARRRSAWTRGLNGRVPG